MSLRSDFAELTTGCIKRDPGLQAPPRVRHNAQGYQVQGSTNSASFSAGAMGAGSFSQYDLDATFVPMNEIQFQTYQYQFGTQLPIGQQSDPMTADEVQKMAQALGYNVPDLKEHLAQAQQASLEIMQHEALKAAGVPHVYTLNGPGVKADWVQLDELTPPHLLEHTPQQLAQERLSAYKKRWEPVEAGASISLSDVKPAK